MPDWWEGKGFHPASKEQCDHLFQKMREAGYEWDVANKTLNEIIVSDLSEPTAGTVSAEESLGISSDNVFPYRYMVDGRPVDKETHFYNLIDGKWCDCKDIISGDPQWSKKAVISALTEELTKRIQPLHEKSLNEKLTDYERGHQDALVMLMSFINSSDFK